MAAEPKGASPVGENDWAAFISEASRTADDLEKRVGVLELYKQATTAEPGSVKLWLAYCEYFHSLHVACQTQSAPSWTPDEIMLGREAFSFDQNLDLWQSAYEEIRLCIGDSHLLWDRWIEVEMEQLSKSRTREGIERITMLYRDRLRTPHITWDETSQRFSSFLSEYSRNNWEATMKEVTENAQEAKAVVDARQRFEFPLQKAARENNVDEERRIMKEYLAWEIAQGRKKGDQSATVPRCQALFARALAGVLTKDETTWLDYIAYLSSNMVPGQTISSLLGHLQRAVDHCPWSGPLWSRYILAAEEAGLSFDDIEQVKHSATNNPQLYRDGLASLLEMYVAWCGYLKRIAINPNAPEEAVDVADVGLPAALESVEVLGTRLYGSEYQGDPDFRLERIYIHYLTEKKGEIEDARTQWELLAKKPLYADKYDFWRAYYLWEMQVFRMPGQARSRSASGSSLSGGPVSATTPDKATAVLGRGVNRKTLDWPERAISVYLQHCNDYEQPHTIRRVRDNVHKIRIVVAKRREREAQEAAAVYAYQTQAQAEAEAEVQEGAGAEADANGNGLTADVEMQEDAQTVPDSPAGTKRKRADTVDEGEMATKRPKAVGTNGEAAAAATMKETNETEGPKRDREHTSVLITNLPLDVTQTALKKYLKDFGRIQNITLVRENETDSSTALVEFEDIMDAQDCIKFRDNKYFNESQIRVTSGAGLTLFVTNFPPAADDHYLLELFKDCGEILSIRWPSLKYNTRRRFCYVSFRDREGAARGTKLDGRLLDERYRLEVKVSDPSRRKRRTDAVSEKREVFVGNLDTALKEAEVRDIFGKYGTVLRVSFVGGRDGRGVVPSGFVEYEDPEAAAKAVEELHNTKVRSRVIIVQLAKAKTKITAKIDNSDAHGGGAPDRPTSPTSKKASMGVPEGAMSPPDISTIAPVPDLPPGAAQSIYENPSIPRKVAIMNLPDTVNEARVAALAGEVGEVEKLVLQPGKGSAVVTFVEEAAAGKAMLALDGRVFEGRRISTGGMKELAKYAGRDDAAQGRGGSSKGEAGKAKGKGGGGRLAPVNVRRPVLGRGGKRGLAKPVVASGGGGSAKEEKGGGGGGGKSNADFKAMFLGGK